KFHDAITFRVADMVCEDNASIRISAIFQHFLEACAKENIVSKDQAYFFFPDKFFSDHKRLSKPIRIFLFGIFKVAAQGAPISEQLLKIRKVVWCGDDEDIAYARHQQGRQ